MRHTSRISRLERLTSVSAERRHAADSESQCDRFSELIMSDPEAHGRAVRLAELLASPGRAAETTAAASALAGRLNCLAA